jgi:GNAT superfamily N-acetyltransferase
MTRSQILYRSYEEGDEDAILDLYNAVFARPQTLSQWRWAYKSNPVGRMDMILAFAGETLVGHSAAIPLRATHDGLAVDTSRIQNVLVHPDFRGKGIFTETLVRLTDQLRDNAVDAVLCYPNDNSLPGLIKAGYTHQRDVFQYHGDAEAAGQAVPGDIDVLVDDALSFTPRDAAFISKELWQFSIYNVRDVAYLTWRYGPDSGYRYRVFRARRGDEMAGFAVTKAYAEKRSIDLVDFVSGGDPQVIRSLLSAIGTAYASEAAGGFDVWAMEHYPEFAALTDMGFRKSNRLAHVFWMALSARASAKSGSSNAYYLSMGDSDVF